MKPCRRDRIALGSGTASRALETNGDDPGLRLAHTTSMTGRSFKKGGCFSRVTQAVDSTRPPVSTTGTRWIGVSMHTHPSGILELVTCAAGRVPLRV